MNWEEKIMSDFDPHSDIYYGIYNYQIIALQWFDEFDYDQDKFFHSRRFEFIGDAKAYCVSIALGVDPYFSGKTWVRKEVNN
jgi:hypothetical protein